MGRKTNSISLRLKKTNKDYNHCWYGDILYAYNFNRSLNMQKIFHDTFQCINIPCPQYSYTSAYKKTKNLLCYLDPVRKKFLSENLSVPFFENYTSSFSPFHDNLSILKSTTPLAHAQGKNKVSNSVYINKVQIDPKGRKDKGYKQVYTAVCEGGAKTPAHKRLHNRGAAYKHKGTYGITFLECKGALSPFQKPSTWSARRARIKMETLFMKNENTECTSMDPLPSSVYRHYIYQAGLMCNFSQKSASAAYTANSLLDIKQNTRIEPSLQIQKFIHLYKYGGLLSPGVACLKKSVLSVYGKRDTSMYEHISEKLLSVYLRHYQQPYSLRSDNAMKHATGNLGHTSPLNQWCSSINLWGNVCSIYILKYTNEKACALFLANIVRYLLERKVLFRRIKRQILLLLSSGIGLASLQFSHTFSGKGKGCCYKYAGVRIVCSGRVGGRSKKAQKSRKEIFMWGETGLHVFSSKLDFAKTYAETSFGTIGIKVWVCYK